MLQFEEQIALPIEIGVVLQERSDACSGCLICEIKTRFEVGLAYEKPICSNATKLEDELAHIVAELYELSDSEFYALERYWDFIRAQ